MEEKKKKSTYNYEAQKKYNAKNKTVTCKIPVLFYDIVVKRAEAVGLSVNRYLITLIENDVKCADMSTAAEAVGADDDKLKDC